jgi:hypothetical protein
VNIAVGLLIVILVVGAASGLMLLVRRRAPEGSYFNDGDRAAGVFGVLATGFSVLLAFIIVLGYQAFDDARSGAESEAILVAQQVETAQYFAEPARSLLSGQLVCYARTVVGPEWQALETGALDAQINPWAGRMFQTTKQVNPQTGVEQSAYDTWMSQTQERELARNARIHGAPGLIPLPMWVVLYVLATILFTYMLFFADSAERAVTQVLLMASVTVVVVSSLLLINFFNHPFGTGVGTLEPSAMERILHLVESEMPAVGIDVSPPCDGNGNPR